MWLLATPLLAQYHNVGEKKHILLSLSPATNLMSSDSLPLTEEPKKTMSLSANTNSFGSCQDFAHIYILNE